MKTGVHDISTSHTECVTPDVLQFINNVWILSTALGTLATAAML